MSLLLDARKKSQQAQGSDGSGLELKPEDHPDRTGNTPDSMDADHARSAGQNLFDAKISSVARAGINRNLLTALGVTVLLLAAGAGYVWYEISETPQPLRLPGTPPAPVAAETTGAPVQPAAATETVPEKAPESAVAVPPTAFADTRPAKHTPAPVRKKSPMRIEQHQSEPIDPILGDAYQAYRAGQYEQAQQLYQKALKLDTRNTDALLGLAATAQRRGADSIAAHYYARVLELNPRDAVANAGMSALTTGDNGESRLKILLNEQQDSSALHFALGNRYAKQARWAEAQQSYFNAYKLESNNAELAFNLAVSLDRLGQKSLAVQYYRRALELNSTTTGSGHGSSLNPAEISQRIESLAP